MIPHSPQGDYPKIDKTAYVVPTAVIIGKVKIGKNVFVAPGAVIRADEPGSSIVIDDNCNVQDRVIIHALKGSLVLVRKNTSLAHGCIIHGPCRIGKNCFVGFGSVVFDAQIGDRVIIKHLSCVEKVKILSGKVVTSGRLIDNQKDADRLKCADKNLKDFVKNVVKVNLGLVKKYKKG
jgi:carbonic anhydrase/acetyltransferase-like protein (isoleucine patch superfamily)